MQIQSYFSDQCSPQHIDPNKSMSCTYAQALRNNRADVVSQVTLDQYLLCLIMNLSTGDQIFPSTDSSPGHCLPE